MSPLVVLVLFLLQPASSQLTAGHCGPECHNHAEISALTQQLATFKQAIDKISTELDEVKTHGVVQANECFWMKVWDKSIGRRSACQTVNTIFVSLAECQTAALNMGGNVINHLHSRCQIKKCDNLTEVGMRPTIEVGITADVYAKMCHRHNTSKEEGDGGEEGIVGHNLPNIEHPPQTNTGNHTQVPIVAISARSSRLRTYKTGETVIFDRLVTSEGPGYNTATGEFTCPYTGLYMVSITYGKEHQYTDGDSLFKMDGVTMFRVDPPNKANPGSTEHSYTYDQASNLAVLKCKKGQVMKLVADTNSMTMDNSYRNMISIYLLNTLP